MADWHDSIKEDTDQVWWQVFGRGTSRYVGSNVAEGSIFFYRRGRRKLRTRYIVCRANAQRQLHITNAEIRYRKSKLSWGVFIDDVPVRHYRTLKAAKLALLPGLLDRMGAEGDRCLDPPCSVTSSKNEA